MTNFHNFIIYSLVLISVLYIVNADLVLSSCNRMDGPLDKLAQGACISSCKFQNCGTGSCQFREGRPVCVCSRCGSGGGEWPIGGK